MQWSLVLGHGGEMDGGRDAPPRAGPERATRTHCKRTEEEGPGRRGLRAAAVVPDASTIVRVARTLVRQESTRPQPRAGTDATSSSP
jgi:hypothetical protein